jgi:hypothetical protein
VIGCAVINKTAFLSREQKMVDSLITCDAISCAETNAAVIVMSNDLDVLPGLAVAASGPPNGSQIALVRGSAESEGLYDRQLAMLGVPTLDWEVT